MFFFQAISLSIEALEESEEKLREGACVALTVLQVRTTCLWITPVVRHCNFIVDLNFMYSTGQRCRTPAVVSKQMWCTICKICCTEGSFIPGYVLWLFCQHLFYKQKYMKWFRKANFTVSRLGMIAFTDHLVHSVKSAVYSWLVLYRPIPWLTVIFVVGVALRASQSFSRASSLKLKVWLWVHQ